MNDIDRKINRPRATLESKLRKNCLVTRSMLVLGWNGVDDYCHAHFFSARDWLRTHLVAFGSVAKNGITIAPRSEVYHYVFNTWSTGYCHWLTETAIKFLLFEESLRKGTVLIPPDAPRFISEFLSMFEFDNILPVDRTVFASKLKLYQNPYHGHHLPSHIELLRSRVYEKVGVREAVKKRKIYISREDAAVRKVVNESEVIEFLRNAGFEIKKPENLAFQEQVQLFSECETLVSIHGAGLTNSIFMPTGGKIIEFFPPPGRDTNYHVLNGAIGNRHEYLLCDFIPPVDSRYSGRVEHSDLIVDIEKLAQQLKT